MLEHLNRTGVSEPLRGARAAHWQRAAKRALDVCAAVAGLLLCAPLFLLLALLIRLDSRGPAFYQQFRIGKGGRPFLLLKLRTMEHGAERALTGIDRYSAQQRADWQRYQKLQRDPRVTRVGRVLRQLSLDELPQLWNVLRGEMSLVGPRPILPEQRGDYGEHLHCYCQVRPGMTGLWQVSGRNRLTFRARARLDADYFYSWSLWLDLKILARTLPVVLSGDGAC